VNITVTGGSGFVGRRLVARLIEEGHSVHVLARRARTGLEPRAQCSIWEAAGLEPPPDSLAGAGAVIHLAGEPVAQRWTPAAKNKIRNSRVEGTRRLVEALARLERPPLVLISASAMGIYGSRGDEVLDESAPLGEGFLAGVCREWEQAADGASALGVRVVKLRLSIVLGKEGGALPQMMTPFRWGLGGTLGSGKQWMSWIHAGDLVELILFSLANPALSGPVNACSPNPVTNAEFTQELARLLRRPAVLAAPKSALRLLYGEMVSILLASLRLAPRAASELGFRFRFPQLRPALRDLLG